MNKKIFVGVIALGFSTLALANGDAGYVPAPAPAPVPTTAAAAAPASSYTPGVYLGLQAGYGMSGYENQTIFGAVKLSGSNGFAGRVFAGYDFHPNFAIEAGYTHFFNNVTVEGIIPGITKGDKTTLHPYAIDLVGKIKANIVDNFGLYAKVGGDYLRNSLLKNDGVFGVTYGVGAYYDITPNFTMDLSWNHLGGRQKLSVANFDDYTPYANTVLLGAMYKFNF